MNNPDMDIVCPITKNRTKYILKINLIILWCIIFICGYILNIFRSNACTYGTNPFDPGYWRSILIDSSECQIFNTYTKIYNIVVISSIIASYRAIMDVYT